MRLSKTVWWMGLLVFLAELSFGFWMAVTNQYIPGDALSRVANAYYVLYSRDPHLAAIGFVWNPLPSLLTLPVLLAWPLYPELASSGLAGVILTGLAAAGTAMMLFHHFIKRGQPYFLSLILCLLVSFNPFLFLYGSNGMSESLFIFFLVWAVLYLTKWFDRSGMDSIIHVGVTLTFAFLTRYEAVAFGACLALSVVLFIWSQRRIILEQWTYREIYRKIEATEIVLLSPVFYSGILWIVLNYMIMNDPLYFLRSNYSNLGQAQQLAENTSIGPLIGHPGVAMQFILIRSACFVLPLAAILFMRLWQRTLFHMDFAIILLLIASIPAMQFVMLVKGSSYGWLRFFVYPLPLAAAWLPYELQRQRAKGPFGYWTAAAVSVLLLLGSAAMTWQAMQKYELAPEEYEAIHYKESATLQKTIVAKQIAEDLDRRVAENPELHILTDSFNAFQIILNVRHSNNLVITSDRDFTPSLAAPYERKVQFILVPNPTGIAGLNAVNQKYGELYEKGTSWARLEKEYNGGWRLYRVTGPIPAERKPS
ncbi:hypothetical protein ACHHV8_06955 [Paenibacillus sp. TAB 01]|uniref:hypothetical protein n=1 Tax=Paenibacillus sp. TAB 01 TaxID=3368988 RepID=UPI003752D464